MIAFKRYPGLVALATVLTMTGCGGGSSSSTSPSLSGTAAVGNPIVGGTVSVTCAGGSTIAPVTTSSTGAWSVTLSGQTLPCGVQVTGGTIGSSTGSANTVTYQSFASSYGTVNITPLTNLVVANVLGSASASLASLTSAQLQAISASNIAAALTRVQTALNFSGLSGASAVDPFTTAFNPTPGVVMDNLLSALATAMTNASTNYAALLAAVGVSNGNTITLPAGLASAMSTAYSALPTSSTSTSGTTSGTNGPAVSTSALAAWCSTSSVANGITTYSHCNGGNASVLGAINTWLSAYGSGMQVSTTSNYSGAASGAGCSFSFEPGLGLWLEVLGNSSLALTPSGFDGSANALVEVSSSGEVQRMQVGDFLTTGREINFMSGHQIDVVYQSVSGSTTTLLDCSNVPSTGTNPSASNPTGVTIPNGLVLAGTTTPTSQTLPNPAGGKILTWSAGNSGPTVTLYDYVTYLSITAGSTGFSSQATCALDTATTTSAHQAMPLCSTSGVTFNKTTGSASFSNVSMNGLVQISYSCSSNSCLLNGSLGFTPY